MASKVAAFFDNDADVNQAVLDLRALGVPDSQLSVIGRGADEQPTYTGAAEGVPLKDVAKGAGKGLLAGVGLGALMGLVAVAIPGTLPLLAVGWLGAGLPTAIGATAGAVIGGTVGTLAGILGEAGLSQHEAQYYAGELERGGSLLAVDLSGGIPESAVREIFARNAGRYAPEQQHAEGMI